MLKAKKKQLDTPSKGKTRKTKKIPGSGNPWPYKDKLEVIAETDLLDINHVLNLECRNRYKIQPSVHVTDDKSANDELFQMFGEMLG